MYWELPVFGLEERITLDGLTTTIDITLYISKINLLVAILYYSLALATLF